MRICKFDGSFAGFFLWPLVVVLAVASFTSLATAQNAASIPNLGDTTTPAPTTPGHALIVGPHEAVNPANGSVSFSFPVELPRGRGFTPVFNITYSSAGSHPFSSFGNEQALMAAQTALYSSDGWSYGVPVLTYSTPERPSTHDPVETCIVSNGYVVEMPDGQRQELSLSVTGRKSGTPPPQPDNPCDGMFTEHTSEPAAGDPSGGWTASTPLDDDAPGGATRNFEGPPLRVIHSDETYSAGDAKFSLGKVRAMDTESIINSLKPGGPEPLTVKPDGAVMDGNTRIKVLQERGVDVNGLPRVIRR